MDLVRRAAQLSAMNAMATHAQDPEQEATLHATLRFAVGVTVAFVVCELMQWAPTFLAPVLTAVLLANLPARPPIKMILALIVTMAVAALFSFGLASLLRGVPFVLFGFIALCMFLAFHSMSNGRARLPAMLLLICLATIPVVVMIAPAQAGIFPIALIRAIALALLATWMVHIVWPSVSAPAAAPAAPAPSSPLAMAVVATAVVVPLMLFYLLFGIADALPVMVATVMLVANFDLQKSRLHATAMIFGNLAGGLLGLLVYVVLLTTPSLPFLSLLLFLVLLGFAQRIVAGGPAAGVALIVCNTMLIILSSAIASGPGSLLLWLTRLFQFVLAGAFAVGMLSLIWHRAAPRTALRTSAHRS
jgi:hypothetical protein